MPARAFFEKQPSGKSRRGGIQAYASLSGFDLDAYRTFPCSESTNASGVLATAAYREPVAVTDA